MVDFVVIGGGVYGSAVAWALSREGAETHLIEKRAIAERASGGPGRRGVRANGRPAAGLALMKRAYDVWPTLHERLDEPQFFERTGHIRLIERESDVPRAEAQVALQQQHGIESRWLNSGELRELEPDVASKVIAGIFCPNDGVASHARATNAYARAARRAGAIVEEGVTATGIEVEGGRATAVLTSAGDRISARRGVLVLSNSSVRDLLKQWITLAFWNEVLQVLITEPVDEIPFRHLIGHAHRTVSLKAEAGRRIMISGGWLGTWDSETEEGHAIRSSIDGNLAEAIAVYPGIEGVKIEQAVASHEEATSLDSLPVIDRLNGPSNVYYASGWSGEGWATAPVIAELLAEWALTGRRPKLLEPFGYNRFEP